MDRYNDALSNPNYCGYCKSEPCQCFDEETQTFNDTSIHYRPCGYCHLDPCQCDGFGGDPVTHEKTCRWCSGLAVGNFCNDCGRAQ